MPTSSPFRTESLYDQSIFEKLERDDSAKTVRNILLMQNGAIGNHIRRNLYGNIDEFIEPAILDYLESRGIQLVTPCPRVNDIIRRLNQLIPERVEECKDLFPGIEWRFVRRLFTMREDIPAVVDDMYTRKRSFPFQCYMNWPIRDPRAYPPQTWDGNITGKCVGGRPDLPSPPLPDQRCCRAEEHP